MRLLYVTEDVYRSAQGRLFMKILVTGATGSIGREVVADAIRVGDEVRTLVRNPSGLAVAARRGAARLELAVRDLSKPATLIESFRSIKAVASRYTDVFAGLHDYEQFYVDLNWKARLHAKKHFRELPFLLDRCGKELSSDHDLRRSSAV